jgi:hypothetical protein
MRWKAGEAKRNLMRETFKQAGDQLAKGGKLIFDRGIGRLPGCLLQFPKEVLERCENALVAGRQAKGHGVEILHHVLQVIPSSQPDAMGKVPISDDLECLSQVFNRTGQSMGQEKRDQ